jgi:uncharacterized membrane protein YozB (DUF420 family)
MQTQSVLIVMLMTFGILQNKKRHIHVRIMTASIIWDVILILQIELSRSAILKASKAMINPMMLNIHVSIAVTTVILYIFMVITGRKMLSGDMTIRKKHQRLGWFTYGMRILTLITSFGAVITETK